MIGNVELRDFLTMIVIAVSVASMLVVSRNARRANRVQVENTDLTRIRDLRAELKETRTEVRETKEELDKVKAQATQLSTLLTEANERAVASARREAEMLRYARMPGMDMATWLARFDPDGASEYAGQVGQ